MSSERIKDLLLTAVEINGAAEHLAKSAQMNIHLLLWQHDLDKKEKAHGTEAVSIEFANVPIFAKMKFTKPVPQCPLTKKNLKVDGGMILNGIMEFNLISCYSLGVTHMSNISIARGVPEKTHPNLLMMQDHSSLKKWEIELKFKDNVLSEVSFEHDFEQHSELTHYLNFTIMEKYKIFLMNICKHAI